MLRLKKQKEKITFHALLLCASLWALPLFTGPAHAQSGAAAVEAAEAAGGSIESAGECHAGGAAPGVSWPRALPGALESSRRAYLRGACLLERGRHGEAYALFQKGLEGDPALAPYWRLQLFRAAAAAGRREQALAQLGPLTAGTPKPEIIEALREILSAAIDPGGKSGGGTAPDGTAEKGLAIGQAAEDNYAYLALFLTRPGPVPEDYPLILHLHQLANRPGRGEMRSKMKLLLWRLPTGKAEAEQWAGAPAELRAGGIEPSSKEHLERTANLFSLRLFQLIIRELEAPGLPRPESPKLGRYYFQSLLRKKEYSKAAREIARKPVLKKFALDEKEAGLLIINIAQRGRQITRARQALNKWGAAYPGEPRLPELYLGMARLHERRRETAAMIGWCEKILREFPGHPLAESAYWLPLWNLYRSGSMSRALNWSDRAIADESGLRPGAGSRFFHWRARILKALGRTTEAEESMRALRKMWPASFYGLMARDGGWKGPPPPRYSPLKPAGEHPPPPRLRAIWERPALRTAVFLLTVGEDELAAALVGGIMGEPMEEELLGELGRLLRYFKNYRLQFRLAANYYYPDLFRSPVADTLVWHNAFPRAYWELVHEHTSRSGISPFFVLAVMREESHFHAKAGSRAGAKGLMQLMPPTAAMEAKRNRLPYHVDFLVEPEANITLGVLYLKRVLKRFKWNPIHAAAAYNAGPNAVRRWTKSRGKLPPDEFIESIPYDETRAYVKRVISSYLIYRKLYQQSPSG